MANHWPQFLADLQTIESAAWPDSTQWVLAANIGKYDWEALTRDGKLVSPWTVVSAGTWSEWSGPSTQVWYVGDVTLFYVTADTADVEVTLMQKLSDMETELRNGFGGDGEFQIIPGGWVQDWGPNNPMNTRLQEQKLDYSAGGLTFRCVVPGASVT